MDFIERLFFPPEDQSFFLFGPRGTGKSMLLGRLFPDAWTLDLLLPTSLARYATRPERLWESWRGAGCPKRVVVDEVQRVPALLDVVHDMLEHAEPAPRFVLTGSSSRKLKRAGVNLLGGRAVRRSLHPFMPCELGTDFDLQRCVTVGLLPLVHSSPSPADTLDAYRGLYLAEEVQQEGVVRDIAPFARFLEAMSCSHAAPINVSGIASECHVPRKTVESYLRVLQDLLLSFHLPVFSKRPKRKTVVSSKFYFFDTGVFRSIRPQGPLSQGDVNGPALEGLVGQSLRAWIEYRSRPGTTQHLYYWRTESGAEVDFVLYGDDGLYAFEVKSSTSIRPKDLNGLKAFADDYDIARCFLLYCGSEVVRKGDAIYCLPVDQFLAGLDPRRDLSCSLESVLAPV